MLERMMSYPIFQEMEQEMQSNVQYTFKFRIQAGVWVNYLPFLKTRQDAIETRALVRARDIPVGEEILEVHDGVVQVEEK